MVQARRKPEVVEAVRWEPGVAIAELTELQTEIHYSETGTLYYVSRPGCRANRWLSVETIDEPTDADRREAVGAFGPSLVQFATEDGRTYWRKVYAFNVTKVRAGASAPVDPTGDLFLDFASAERWSKVPTPTAVLHRGTSDAQVVNRGDWVVRHPCGKSQVLTDARFHSQFDVEV